GCVLSDDASAPKRLDPLDGAPLAHRVHLQRTLRQLRLLPALGEILAAALDAARVVLVVLDLEPLVGEEPLLHCDPPGPIVRVAVTLDADHNDICNEKWGGVATAEPAQVAACPH